MKLLSNLRLVMVLLALMLGIGRAQAAPGFLLSASNLTTTATTTNIFFTNNLVTTFITISNLTAFEPASITYVTNDFSDAVTVTGFSENSTNLTAVTNGNSLVFTLLNVATNPLAQFNFTWLPLTTGPVTNTIIVAISYPTNSTTTNFVTTNLVINQVYGQNADLGVTNYIISQAYVTNDWVITNDWVTYGVTVTNRGPGTATGVVVTNTLPPDTTLVSASQGATIVGGTNLILTMGTLASGTAATWQFTIQPGTNGVFALVDSVTAPSAYDTNSLDNTATIPLSVTNYLAALAVGTNSASTNYNQLDNLYEQLVGVTNGSARIGGVRVVVTGLAASRLQNASGTNNGQPFVVCPAQLATNGTVEKLLLQFFPSAPATFSNSQLQAFVLPSQVLNYTPFPSTLTKTNLNIHSITRLKDGEVALQFNNPGSSYTVVYSTNANFANAMIATPVVTSQASSILWLDYGPPETISAPTNSTQRFYRVYQNP